MSRKTKSAAILTIGLALIVFCAGCRSEPKNDARMLSESNLQIQATGNKPIVAIIVDSLMDKTVQEAVKQGRAPALKYMIEHGHYFPRVISSFPTMSVTIDSTFMTGVYTDRHHVPGLVWYNDREKRMIFYGNGPMEALKIDQLQVLTDSVYHLNQVQLSKDVKTIHEELADAGKRSASVNAVIYRGRTRRDLPVPEAMARTSRLPDHFEITAPELFSFAAFARLAPENDGHTAVWEKYGMNDKFTARDLAYLVKEGKLPDVTIAYFPGNDNVHHRKGSNALKGVERADQALQNVLNAYGSWAEAIEKTVWLIVGDSGQSDVLKDRDAKRIDLRQLLNGYRIARLNEPVAEDDQIVIASNERMAYIYAISPEVKLADLASRLQQEERLDMIAVKEGGSVRLTAGGKHGNSLLYSPGGPYTDEFGQAWSLEGDLALADITLDESAIGYGIYPDVLARLYGALHSHDGQFAVVTVQPGYELAGENSPIHRGAAHGSLHEVDSIVPLIVAGTDSQPKAFRIVDMKEWILRLASQ